MDLKSIEEKHYEKFGIKPYVLGMFWNDIERQISNIEKAIRTNKPYNEYEMLTKEEQKEFDEGNLLF